jgi:hypothetical protein
VRTGSGTGTARTITGTASQIGVTNGDGVSDNPVLSLLGNALAFAGLTGAADKLAYFTSSAAMAVTNLVSQARSFLADPSAAYVTFLPAGTGATARTMQEKGRDFRDVRDYGVLADSTGTDGTDWTTTLVALFGDLEADGYRGILRIPWGVRFTATTVYAAVYPGLTLRDESGINFGQSPGYRSNYNILVDGSIVTDDVVGGYLSGHHPAQAFINTGTSGSDSGELRRASPVLWSVGIYANKDPALVWQSLYQKNASSGDSEILDVLCTPYKVAIANPVAHTPSTVYAAGAYCIGVADKVYKTTAGGTSGATMPSGTGTGISDGVVLWDYVQAARDLQATRFTRSEDGSFEQSGPGPIHHKIGISGGGSTGVYVDGTLSYRFDTTLNLSPWLVDPVSGYRRGIAESRYRLPITGSPFEMPATGEGKTSVSGTLSTCTMPTGRTAARMSIFFEASTTTLSDYSSGGGANFWLRDGCDVTPPQGAEITFERTDAFSSLWYEVARSFDDVRKNTTANRPVIATNRGKGYLYLDTTLDADGKPIWWTGSAWVDATGATV